MLLRKTHTLVIFALVLSAGVTLIDRAQSQKPPVVPPRPIKMFKPDCGAGQSCHGIHGLVVVTVDVLTDGTVGDATVKKGDSRLVDAALKAAKQCRFQPGTFAWKTDEHEF